MSTTAFTDYDATYTDYDATYTDYDATYTDFDATDFATEVKPTVTDSTAAKTSNPSATPSALLEGVKDDGGDKGEMVNEKGGISRMREYFPDITAMFSGIVWHWHLVLFIIHAVAATFALIGGIVTFSMGNYLASAFWAAYEVKDDINVWPRPNEMKGYVKLNPNLSPWLTHTRKWILATRACGYFATVTSFFTFIGMYPFLLFVVHSNCVPFKSLLKSKFKKELEAAAGQGAEASDKGSEKKDSTQNPPEITKFTTSDASGESDLKTSRSYTATDFTDYTDYDYTVFA